MGSLIPMSVRFVAVRKSQSAGEHRPTLVIAEERNRGISPEPENGRFPQTLRCPVQDGFGIASDQYPSRLLG